MNEQARQRLIERHCAATARALCGRTGVEYRRRQLFLAGRPKRFLVPHLASPESDHSLRRSRGIADAMALRLLYCDIALHRQLVPQAPVAHMVFDILEQLRCEANLHEACKGVRANINGAFDRWCAESRGNGLIENELGLIIYAVTQIVRSRLSGAFPGEMVEGLIESARFRLAPLMGNELAMLGKNLRNQAKFAQHALKIADAVHEIAKSLGQDAADRHLAALRSRSLLPPASMTDDKYVESCQDAGTALPERAAGDCDYRVFTRAFDQTVSAGALYRLEQRQALRTELNHLVAAQAISITRLAQRLQRLFAVAHRSGWHEGKEEGVIDGRRLSQLAANHSYTRVFKQEQNVPRCETAITFLIDNSGSMKRQRFTAVSVLVDIYCRALEMAGIQTEVLGFTTCSWAGGEAMRLWKKEASPEFPGRVGERRHIIYKDFDQRWKQSRYSLSAMLNPLHFKEGLDGEALQWACQRLLSRSASRKCLVMISDGAPMETATMQLNGEDYLERHLREIARRIELDGQVELGAIGIDLELDGFFRNAVNIDLTGTLGLRAFTGLEQLFA